MSHSATREQLNFQLLMLIKALVGSVTPNFVIVYLMYQDGEWLLKFQIEKNIKEDIDEIEDVVRRYAALQDSTLRYRHEVIIGSGGIPNYGSLEGLQTISVAYRRNDLRGQSKAP